MNPMAHAHPDSIQITARFSSALDHEDWAKARSLLQDDCEYVIRGRRVIGQGHIIQEYRASASWGSSTFDEITYRSQLEKCRDGRIRVTFIDRIRKGDHRHVYKCDQVISVDQDGLINRIMHFDRAHDEQQLVCFLETCGIHRSTKH